MTAVQLKVLLDSFVAPEERNFQVRFVTRQTRRILGTYRRSTRMITIITNNSCGPLSIVATGLHELAHHMSWPDVVAEQFLNSGTKRRIRHHGRTFLVSLTMMVYEFNRRYANRLRGRMMYDPRRPAQSPWFMDLEDILLETIFGAKLTDQPLCDEIQSPVLANYQSENENFRCGSSPD